MYSEEQWKILSPCTCGAIVFRMNDKVISPGCCCNDVTVETSVKRTVWSLPESKFTKKVRVEPEDMVITVEEVPELTDEMPNLDYVIDKLKATRAMIKPLTPVQRLAVKILEEL